MIKSLRNRLLVRTLIALVLIVGANRLVSHQLSSAYVMEAAETGMALILARCDTEGRQGQSAFRSCARAATEQAFFEHLALNLTACPLPDRSQASNFVLPPICGQLLADRSAVHWQAASIDGATGLQRAETVHDTTRWLLFRASQASADVVPVANAIVDAEADMVVLVRHDDISGFLHKIWDMRDWIFIYVVPLTFVGVVGMTWVMLEQLMKPLRQMQNTITTFSSSNLDRPVSLANPYREFSGVMAAFDDLRGRLHTSFTQSQRFAADASHELRTPLTILRGHVEQAIDGLPAGSDTQVQLRVIEDEISRLVGVTDKLLLLSRVDAEAVHLTREPLDLSEWMQELVADVEGFEPNLKVTADIAPGVIWHCDSQLVRQLVHNLFTNAVNYNISGGWVHFQLRAASGWLTLTLENPAQDFTPEHEAKAFDRFYRGSASRTRKIDGQGLGLSLCREIAHLHGGELTLTALRKGTGAEPSVVCAKLRAPLMAVASIPGPS